jgi:hypothetical protein
MMWPLLSNGLSEVHLRQVIDGVRSEFATHTQWL